MGWRGWMVLVAGCGDMFAPHDLPCPEGAKAKSSDVGGVVELWCDAEVGRQGPYERRQDGAVIASGAYADGEPDGSWITRHADGELASRGSFAHGRRVRTWTWWHASGALDREGDYLDGREQGRWIEGWPSGHPKAEGEYHLGRKHGRWVYYADEPGKKVTEVESWRQGERLPDRVHPDEALVVLAAMDGCWPEEAWWADQEAGGAAGAAAAQLCWTPHDRSWKVLSTDERSGARRTHELVQVELGETEVRYTIGMAVDRRADGTLDSSITPRVLILADAGEHGFAFETGKAGYPERVRVQRDGDRLTVTTTGTVDGAERAEIRTYRTDVDLKDVGRNLDKVFKDVAKGLDED